MKVNSMLRIGALAVMWSLLHIAWAQSATLTQIVLQATPTETLIANPDNEASNIRLDVSVTGNSASVPTGSITYLLKPGGTSALQTATISLSDGMASWLTSAPVSSYTISATYSGDINYRPTIASLSETQQTTPPDFGFDVSPLIIKQGQSWTGSIQVISLNGFAQHVSFSCTAPTYLECSLPASQPESNSNSSVPLTITTYAGQFTGAYLLILPFAFGARRRRKTKITAHILLLAVGLFSMCGCGMNSRAGWQPITPTGTYNVTITGVSGSLQHTKQLTIIVE